MKNLLYLILAFVLIILIGRACSNTPGNQINNQTKKSKDTLTAIQKDSITRAVGIEQEKKAAEKIKNQALLSQLKKQSRRKNDEFSETTFYYAKSSAPYVNANSVHCYLSVTNDEPTLRFRVQYLSDDWLFIEKAIFNIDGKNYEFIPTEMKRDNDGGEIWEWADEVAGATELEIIEALAVAKNAKVKYLGSEYSDIKPVTQKQRANIKHILELYEAFRSVK